MSEAIQVPWTPQEALDGGVSTPDRSGPLMTEPARSDTEELTPLSMTATVTPRPWVTAQADGAWIMFSTHISWSRTASALAGIAVTAHSPAAASATPTNLAAIRARRAGRPSTLALPGRRAAAGRLPGDRPPSRPRRLLRRAFPPSRRGWPPRARAAGRRHNPPWRTPGRGRRPAATK